MSRTTKAVLAVLGTIGVVAAIVIVVYFTSKDGSAGAQPTATPTTASLAAPTNIPESPTVTATATAVPTETSEPSVTAVPPTVIPEPTKTTEPSATTEPTEVVEATPVQCDLVIGLVSGLNADGDPTGWIEDIPGGFYYVADQYGNENPGVQIQANQPSFVVEGIANPCGWIGSVRVAPSTQYQGNTAWIKSDNTVLPSEEGKGLRYLVLEPMPPTAVPTNTPIPTATPEPTMTPSPTATATLEPVEEVVTEVPAEIGSLSDWVVKDRETKHVIEGAAFAIVYDDDGSGQFGKTNGHGQLQGTVQNGRSGRMSVNHLDYTGIADLNLSAEDGQVLISGEGASIDEDDQVIYLSQEVPLPTNGTESNVNAQGCQDGDQVCQEQALILFIPGASSASCIQGIATHTAPAGTWVAFRGIDANAGYIYHRTTTQSEQFEGWMCTVWFPDGTSISAGLNRICANAYIFPEAQPMVPVKPIPPKPQPETTPPPSKPTPVPPCCNPQPTPTPTCEEMGNCSCEYLGNCSCEYLGNCGCEYYDNCGCDYYGTCPPVQYCPTCEQAPPEEQQDPPAYDPVDPVIDSDPEAGQGQDVTDPQPTPYQHTDSEDNTDDDNTENGL